MAGYVIAEVEVTDPTTYNEYRQVVPATLEKYGGKFLVRGGRSETLEGDWQPKRLVVIEFESLERAKEWWASEAYRGPKSLRQRAAKTNLIALEGA